jgi:FKBP-type peptidyl-prolyl cis-trans isomerase FkpA
MFELTEAELALLQKGIEDQALHKQAAVDLKEYGPKISMLARQRSNKANAKAAEAEKGRAVEYLAKMEKEAGVQKLPSGVLYFEQQAGTGEQPTASSVVKVHYRGTLVDGTEFDSSYKRNQPTEFPLSGVIPCWTQGVQMMKVGGKAKLVCPSDTAYGDRGSPPNIPGGAALTFEVELLEVKAQPSAPPMPTLPPPPSGKPVAK